MVSGKEATARVRQDLELPVSLAHRVQTGRDLLRSREAVHREALFPTGIAMLDPLLGGGVERGALTELVGGISCGRFSVVLSLAALATAAGEAVALVDLGDGLDPGAFVEAGGDAARLLWMRPRRWREALASAEIAATGGFPLVLLDLGPPPLPGAASGSAGSAWMRLQRTAERHRTALVLASPYRVSGPAAVTVARLSSGTSRRGGVWSGQGIAPHLLVGIQCNVVIDKLRLDKLRQGAATVPEHCLLRCDEAARYDTRESAASTRTVSEPPRSREHPDHRPRRLLQPPEPLLASLPPAWMSARLAKTPLPAADGPHAVRR